MRRAQIHETTARVLSKSLTYSELSGTLSIPEDLLNNLDNPSKSQSFLLNQYFSKGETGTGDLSFILFDYFLGNIESDFSPINTGDKIDGLY